jgi:exopolyphosphatase/guanosine-5'-triphosphate,3'-diphosphate pyrophosphatase
MIAAAVDVGSNSVHLLVANLTDGRLETLVDVSEQLGLGDFVDNEGSIPEGPQLALVGVLTEYRDLALAQGAQQVTFVGTEPLRRAANGREVAELVEERTGIPLQILDKEEEGELAFLGVTCGTAGKLSMLIVDIGGGSTQVVFYEPDHGVRVTGLDIGSKRLSKEIVEHDPPTPDEVARLRARATEVAATLPEMSPQRAVFVGGTPTNIVRLRPLATAEFDALYETLTTVPAAELAERYVLRPRRALQLAAGAALAEAILQRYALEAAEVSDASLRDGAIIAAARRSNPASA